MRGDPIRLGGVPPTPFPTLYERAAYHTPIFDTVVVANVTVATITPVIPARPNGTAVVVAPGGGFHVLSIDSEGFEVAEWLADRGITAFVLEYRLIPLVGEAAEVVLAKPQDVFLAEVGAVLPVALADGAAAVRTIRARSADWGVDPSRVGAVGFSAGGSVVTGMAVEPDPASRPDFTAAIYAVLRWQAPLVPPEGAGPMFVLAATDDELGLAPEAIELYRIWTAAGLSAELHLYSRGGHGFGMRPMDLPIGTWIDRFGDWMSVNGWMSRPS